MSMSIVNRLTRGEAIHVFCVDKCKEGHSRTVSKCEEYDCPLWRYRKGNEDRTRDAEK